MENIDYDNPENLISHSVYTVPEITTKWKYNIKDKDAKLKKELDSLLERLNAFQYKDEIISIIKSKKFSRRCSNLERIAAATYHILRRDGFPIIIKDLECMGKPWVILNLVFKDFPPFTEKEIYNKNLFDRHLSYLRLKGYKLDDKKASDVYNIILEYIKIKNIPCISNLILGALAPINDITEFYENYGLSKFLSIRTLKKNNKEFNNKIFY
ncbi:hypothetical protein TCON_0271 [Astathelohania contejeani]|uniref:Uncharacterized protein n=1 Tax=Astathelohania contejeani TaxID=164912 RepID=A0ABQ7I2B7_9MICR|nr:hypothetical protein TCON_0271 [Thelohania contejeani]